jgi:hypothetical protein
MPPSPARAERRRPRRGSLERPVDGRLYRSAFLLVALPLLILAFSITRPAPLSAPTLPPSFDGPATRALAVDLAGIPARPPGSAGALAAANWFREQVAPYGLPISADTWQQDVPGLGRVRLQNLWAVARGRSADAIVVMAHRDNTGIGQGANDDASGTAALVELARSYAETSTAQPGTPAPQSVRPVHTLVFLSTDGGSFGGLGAARFAQHLPFRVVATVNLTAIAGQGPPRILIAGDTPRSPAATLVETAAKRVLEQTGTSARRTSVLGQLLDLAFPLTFYEQGPFVTHGIPAVTLTTAGQRPPDAFTDRPSSLDGTRLAGVGRAAQQLLGSLDQGLELTQGTTSFVWAGARVVRGWAIELLLAALLIPFFVASVDLFAHCRRRRIPLRPAVAALRSRLGFWLFVGLSFYGFRALGAWPGGPDRPPNPASAAAGNWPVLALITLAALLGVGWIVARHRLVPRRVVGPDELLAGETVGLLALGLVALLVLATNPFALVFVLPALHAWLWLPQVRSGRGPARVLVFAIGLAGPLVLLGSLAFRFGLGFDAPWYALQLVNVGYVSVASVGITLAAGACAAQLAAATAGRYAPYPRPRERPPRGPLRGLVRAIILAERARRTKR